MQQEQAQKEKKQFILSFDGKMVGEGSKSESDGDVNLWGHESKVPVGQALEERNFLIDNCACIEGPITKQNVGCHIYNIHTVMTQVAKQIRSLHSHFRSEFFMRQCLFNLVENNPNDLCHFGTH